MTYLFILIGERRARLVVKALTANLALGDGLAAYLAAFSINLSAFFLSANTCSTPPCGTVVV